VRVYRVRDALTHPAANAPGSPLSRNAGEGAERQRREAGEGGPALPLPDKPSIAVLPFQNISGDPEQEYFADGMVEEIITALSRIRWLFVIARNSSFTYKGQAVDVKQVGGELGVRYVLEGSVRKAAGRVRITAQLIDAMTGAHLWADRFDGSLEDVFELQDRVAVSVAGVIEPALQAAEIRRSIEQPTKDPTAYDLYIRALAHCATFDEARNFEALSLLERAIERDPSYGLALSLAAQCRTFLAMSGWVDDRETNRLKAVSLARRALQTAGDDPVVLVHAAHALAYSGENIRAMLKILDRALSLNPSFARGWHFSGVLRIWAGQYDLAIEHVETGLRLSPRERVGMTSAAIGTAHLLARRFDKAEQVLLVAIEEDPGYAPAYRALAACYTHLGRLGEARKIVHRLRAITSDIVPNFPHLQNAEDREFLLSALRLAAREAT
jgi:adenylate cyclase